MSPEKTPETKPAAPARATRKTPGPDIMEIDTTAVANARTDILDASQSLIGSAVVDGDATFTTSAAGMVSVKGAATVSQGGAGAIVAEGDVSVRQGGGAVIVGRTIDVDQGGGCVLVSGEANASHSYVGVLVSRRASLSEDSRVLFDWKAALILAGVLLGGLGLVIVVAVVLAKMVMGRVHRVTERLPHISAPHLPEIPPWVMAVARRIRAA